MVTYNELLKIANKDHLSIEEIIELAYREGFSDGESEGYNNGCGDGYNRCYNAGFGDGLLEASITF